MIKTLLIAIIATAATIGQCSDMPLVAVQANYKKLQKIKDKIKKQNENLEEKEKKIKETKKALENYKMVKKENIKIINKLKVKK